MSLKSDVEQIQALKLGVRRTRVICNILADVERRKIYAQYGLPFSSTMKWVHKDVLTQKPAEPNRDTDEREENEL